MHSKLMLYYNNCSIVSKHPDVSEFFNKKGITGESNPSTKALGQRLFTDLDIAINLLDDSAALHEYLRLVAIRHEAGAGDKTSVFLDVCSLSCMYCIKLFFTGLDQLNIRLVLIIVLIFAHYNML